MSVVSGQLQRPPVNVVIAVAAAAALTVLLDARWAMLYPGQPRVGGKFAPGRQATTVAKEKIRKGWQKTGPTNAKRSTSGNYAIAHAKGGHVLVHGSGKDAEHLGTFATEAEAKRAAEAHAAAKASEQPKPPVKPAPKPPAVKPAPRTAPKSEGPPVPKVTPRKGTPQEQAEAMHAEVTRVYAYHQQRLQQAQTDLAKARSNKELLSKRLDHLERNSPKKLGVTSAEKSKQIKEIYKEYQAEGNKEGAAASRIQASLRDRQTETFKALHAPEGPAVIAAGGGDMNRASNVAEGRKQLGDLLGHGHPFAARAAEIEINEFQGLEDRRAYYQHNRGSGSHIRAGPEIGSDVIVHEYIHGLEYRDKTMHANAIAFRDRRTAGESLVDITPPGGSHGKEECYPDKFFSKYCGKVYQHEASEIVTMGVQRMCTDAGAFAKEDPDYFKFIASELRRSHG